jgi:hypothetical protein
MLRKPTIRALGSIFLLMTFSFSITPKIVLHHLVAHHKDIHSSINGNTTDQLTKAGYHCDCESLVVVLPYLGLPAYIPQDVPDCFLTFPVRIEDQIDVIGHYIFGFRGPPATTFFF